MSILEAIMLLCFGAAWPFSIVRSIRSKSTQGKSFFFLFILIIGYLAGIANKLLYSNDIVVYLYLLNLIMVSIDAILWIRNHNYEKTIQKGEQQ